MEEGMEPDQAYNEKSLFNRQVIEVVEGLNNVDIDGQENFWSIAQTSEAEKKEAVYFKMDEKKTQLIKVINEPSTPVVMKAFLVDVPSFEWSEGHTQGDGMMARLFREAGIDHQWRDENDDYENYDEENDEDSTEVHVQIWFKALLKTVKEGKEKNERLNETEMEILQIEQDALLWVRPLERQLTRKERLLEAQKLSGKMTQASQIRLKVIMEQMKLKEQMRLKDQMRWKEQMRLEN